MSIKVMARVWDHSEQEGGDLLLLLALADWADEEGYCWPKQEQLATKARCSVRAVRDQLVRLTAAGEIERSDGRGRGVGSTYRVLTGLAETANAAAPAAFQADKKRQVEARKAAICDTKKRQVEAQKAADCCRSIENHQEPSLTVKEPSEEEGSRTRSRTRPAPKPTPQRRPPTLPPSSSVIDPTDKMQAAVLEACGLDPVLARHQALEGAVDAAARLKARHFTPDEIRAAAAAWTTNFPGRDPEDIEPPHPQQLAEWVGRRRAAEAMRTASAGRGGRSGSRAGAALSSLVPFIER